MSGFLTPSNLNIYSSDNDNAIIHEDGTIVYEGNRDLDGVILAIEHTVIEPIDDYSDLLVQFYIKPRNSMKGTFNHIGASDSTLDTKLFARSHGDSDLDSRIVIRAYEENDFDANYFVTYRGNSDLEAYMMPISADILDAVLDVRPFTYMLGTFDLIEPPRINENLIPNKDAVTRSSVENRFVNFGNNATMLVGRDTNANESLQSFLQFDLSRYAKTTKFTKAVLKLYYSYQIDEDNLELKLIDTFWDEYGITYENKPTGKDLISNLYTVNANEYYIEFDLLEYVEGVMSGSVPNEGLILDSLDSKSYTFFTKESSKKPLLQLEYYDTRIWSTGDSDLEGVFFHFARGEIDLSAKLKVKETFDTEDLNSILFIHRYDTPVDRYLDARLSVTNPDLNAKYTVRQSDYSDLNAKMVVYISGERFLDGNLGVTIPDLDAKIYIRPSEDLECKLTVRAFEKNYLDGDIISSTPELNSTLLVRYRNDLNAILSVPMYEDKDFDSSFGITNPDLNAEVFVRYYRDFECILYCEGVVVNEIDAELTVNTPELNSTLYVRYNEDLDSTLSVTYGGEDGLQSKLRNSTPELEAKMMVYSSRDFEARVGVITPELNAILLPRILLEEDFEGRLMPRVIGVSDLECILLAENERRKDEAYYFIM